MNARLAAGLWLLAAGCTTRVAIFRLDDVDGAVRDADSADAPPDQDAGRGDASDDGATAADAGATLSLSAIAAFGHTCAAGDDGLFCWGRNRDGQLGLGADRSPKSIPVQVSDQRYTQVCAAEQHGCALRVGGTVECWGNNERGQLGLGDSAPRAEPTPIVGLSFRAIACGGRISCGVTDERSVACWGENAEGGLGQDDSFGSPDLLVPTPIAAASSFSQVSVGQGHVCAVAEGGALYCWGRNTSGQLGLGGGPVQVRVPTLVDASARYRRVAAAMNHSCAIREDGSLFCWGSESDGQLGLGTPELDRSDLPRQVSGTGYLDVQANWFHSCALRTGGSLSCWGRNLEGQLGIGNTMGRGREEPAQVAGEGFSALSVGHFHSCALRKGAVYCWGKNDDDSELGLGVTGRRDVPTLLSFP